MKPATLWFGIIPSQTTEFMLLEFENFFAISAILTSVCQEGKLNCFNNLRKHWGAYAQTR